MMSAGLKFVQLLRKFYTNAKMEFDEFDEELYLQGVKPIGYEAGTKALMQLAIEKGFHKVPTVQQILEAAGHAEMTERDKANLMAGEILDTAARLGEYRTKEAEAKLGPEAWEVVRRMGGWQAICMSDVQDHHILRAQMRDMSQAVILGGSQTYLPPGDALREALALAEGNVIPIKGVSSDA